MNNNNQTMPKLKIECYGKSTFLYVDGHRFGEGIKSIEFKAEAGEVSTLKLEAFIPGLKITSKEELENQSEESKEIADPVREIQDRPDEKPMPEEMISQCLSEILARGFPREPERRSQVLLKP